MFFFSFFFFFFFFFFHLWCFLRLVPTDFCSLFPILSNVRSSWIRFLIVNYDPRLNIYLYRIGEREEADGSGWFLVQKWPNSWGNKLWTWILNVFSPSFFFSFAKWMVRVCVCVCVYVTGTGSKKKKSGRCVSLGTKYRCYLLHLYTQIT
jgi:hypothetical protein